jgi:Z1 domain
MENNQLETSLLDSKFSLRLDEQVRGRIWNSVDEILSQGPMASDKYVGNTGLALGYVQSGKTTTITALLARAADHGYRIIITFLGSTNLLLSQNADRIETAIGIGDKGERRDYQWFAMQNPSGSSSAKELADFIGKDRTILISVLKHAGRIDALAEVLLRAKVANIPTLIVDDEADQASLNTEISDDLESKTYAAISKLRATQPNHLYVQFTATPYAPLLLHPSDHLSPNFVTFLHPGKGYTGGREFFVDYADKVIRPIPMLDEQTPKGLPTELPKSLVSALANFTIGASILLEKNLGNAPISMLVHSTQKNDVQARYHHLIERQLRHWREHLAEVKTLVEFPDIFQEEYRNLVNAGAQELSDELLVSAIKRVLLESKTWLLNSTTSIKNVNWNVTPIHILVGGNKLDRGFTVEGLTVTYMNRPPTDQVDTLEQRARAFGYRGELLPYCQFFATPRTLKLLREIVFTEYDLRAKLQDWLTNGGSVSTWADQIGLMLPAGMKPSRTNVLETLSRFNSAKSKWHSLRRIDVSGEARINNMHVVHQTGLLESPSKNFGRLDHKLMEMPLKKVISEILVPWKISSYSPEWRHADILDYLERQEDLDIPIQVLLMELSEGVPRVRDWDSELGFINLFQGEDVVSVPGKPFYQGDRKVPFGSDDDTGIALQIHHIKPKDDNFPPSYTLAIHLGKNTIIKREKEKS